MTLTRSERRQARSPALARYELLVGRISSGKISYEQVAADLLLLLDQIALIEHERDQDALDALRRRYNWNY